MRFTFTVNSDSDLGKAERRAEKRQRAESAKALRLARSNQRRDKAAAQRFFA
jgi:hypothetical protein